MIGIFSISDFVYYTAMRIRMATRCVGGVGDKLNLFVWAILESFPRTVRGQSSTLDLKLRSIANTLTKHIVVQVNGIKYSLSDRESLWLLNPEFEKYVWSYLKPRGGEVFIDVGAHIGKYALQVARIVGDEGLVIAMEPHPENYQALLRGIWLNGLRNIISLNAAAWDEDCKLKLFIGDRGGSHSVKRDMALGHVEVEARTVDHVLEELNVKQVNWVKIDVEGAELEVLRGLKNTLKKHVPKLIIEVASENLGATREFMRKYGYTTTLINGLYFFHRKFSGQHRVFS